MGAVDTKKPALKYEVQRQKGTIYEVYSYRKDVNDEWQYLECFLTDMFGRVFEYEVWSDALQEFIMVDITNKKSEYYKNKFAELNDLIKIAIVEHEINKGVAL